MHLLLRWIMGTLVGDYGGLLWDDCKASPCRFPLHTRKLMVAGLHDAALPEYNNSSTVLMLQGE